MGIGERSDLYEKLVDAIYLLDSTALSTWIFGGWAKELRQVIPPRVHHDIDLLYPAETFFELDEFIRQSEVVEEIVLKRFSHKRALLFQGMMVEFLLVRQKEEGYFTDFFGSYRFNWPENVFEDEPVIIDNSRLKIASKQALIDYRKSHKLIESASHLFI
jgi:hypothetical protein